MSYSPHENIPLFGEGFYVLGIYFLHGSSDSFTSTVVPLLPTVNPIKEKAQRTGQLLLKMK